jgi:hypothetical protein
MTKRHLPGLPRTLMSLSAGFAVMTTMGLASGADDARVRQLRLLCMQLSGDLTDPGGMAAFNRCMSTGDPLGEIRRDNNIAEAPADRPNAAPPGGFGRNSRVHVANGTERFQTADASLVYVLDQAGKLWRGTMDGKDGRLLDQNVSAFQVSDGRLFAQGVDGTLWRAKTDGSERTRIDQTVEAFQPVNAGLIYVLGTDHILWRETGDAGKRAEVDRTVKDFQAIDGNLVFVLGADGTLWREAGTAKSRTLAAGQVTTFQYVPNGDTIYVQTADTLLWRKSANEKAELVDQSVAAFQAVDSHLVFVLGKDGRLWREPGGRDQAVLVDRDVLVNRGQGRIPGGRPGARLPTRQRSSALGRDDAAGAMTEGALVPSSRSGSLTFVSIQPDGALDGIPSGP